MTLSAPTTGATDDGTLRLTDLLHEGLAANDRLKYFLTLLQVAIGHARQPFAPLPDLRAARDAAGVADAGLDGMIAASRRLSDGVTLVPGAARIRERLFEDLGRMLDPLRSASSAFPELHARAEAYERRLDAQAGAVPAWIDDRLETSAVDALADAGDEQHDTVHRLVMDLHRELNGLVAAVSVDSVDGARVLAITQEDRALVSAFMSGVNRTAPLKFDHPGLGTTAARSGDALSIQNDLGTTEGHVVVIRVSALTATVTYADVHHKRVRFLKDLLRAYAIQWEDGPPAREGQLETVVGRFTGAGLGELEQFLMSLGSRLVFLIDWNRARKQIARFLSSGDAVKVLAWAADHDVGHRGFLQAGGTELICRAFERIAPARVRYGSRLDELIGRDAASGFLTAVLRIASAGLRDGQSTRLIQDEIEAELLCRLDTPDRQLLDAVAEHAMLLSALAERVRLMLLHAGEPGCRDDVVKGAALARTWELRAGDLVENARRTIDRSDGGRLLKDLLQRADDVADGVEEAAFLLTLLGEDVPRDGVAVLSSLADLMTAGAKDYVRALDYARGLRPGRLQPEVEEVLVCVDRLDALERSVDDAERKARSTLLSACTSFRDLHVLSSAAAAMERAADALGRCAAIVRDYALSLGGGRP
jgi:uncharacterized protein Yka (UPF0111/DUF47 family)